MWVRSLFLSQIVVVVVVAVSRSSSTGTLSKSSSPSTGRVSSTRRARPRATTTERVEKRGAARPAFFDLN